MGPGAVLVTVWHLPPPIHLPSTPRVTTAVQSCAIAVTASEYHSAGRAGVWMAGQAALVDALLPEPSQRFPESGS